MRILVTGATGFLGSHTTRELQRAGHAIVALTRPGSDRGRLSDIASSIEWIVRGTESLDACLAGAGNIDVVLHTAASYARSEPVSATVEANLVFPLSLLEWAQQHGVSAFLSTSTALDSTVSEYALSKHQFDEWGRRLTHDSPLRFIEARLQLMFGPGDDDWKLVPWLIQGCLSGERALSMTTGEQRRDLIFVDDAARALRSIIEAPDVRGAVDVGNGESVTVRGLAEQIRELAGCGIGFDFGARPYRANEPMNVVADPTALRALGWYPQVPIAEGLRRTIEWYRNRLAAEGAISST